MASSGRTVCFTNGCFDIIHPGHVHLLRAARSLADVLVVGVNTDDSVRRLKGTGRPVNSLQARLDVLLEMRSVDRLVAFDTDTPLELIRSITPDVLVKGGDYTVETVVGADHVLDSGGKVEIVPLLGGYSTTSILNVTARRENQS